MKQRGTIVKIDTLVFNCAPKPFRKYIIDSTSPTVHTDSGSCGQYAVNEPRACKVASLITVKYRGCPNYSVKLKRPVA